MEISRAPNPILERRGPAPLPAQVPLSGVLELDTSEPLQPSCPAASAMDTMDAAVALLLLCAAAGPATGSFFYQSVYPEPLPLQLQSVYQAQLQPLALPQLQQLPYVSAPYSPYVPFPIAVPANSIYSQAQASRALLGYSYEMQDITGGRSQVLYVAGPNSRQVFQQNAGALHFIPQKLNFSDVQTENHNVKSESAPVNTPPVNYFAAQVIPRGRALFGTAPLFMYSVNVNPTPAKNGTSEDDFGESVPKSTSSTDMEKSKEDEAVDEAVEESSGSSETEKPDSPAQSESSTSESPTSVDSLKESSPAPTDESPESTTKAENETE